MIKPKTFLKLQSCQKLQRSSSPCQKRPKMAFSPKSSFCSWRNWGPEWWRNHTAQWRVNESLQTLSNVILLHIFQPPIYFLCGLNYTTKNLCSHIGKHTESKCWPNKRLTGMLVPVLPLCSCPQTLQPHFDKISLSFLSVTAACTLY